MVKIKLLLFMMHNDFHIKKFIDINICKIEINSRNHRVNLQDYILKL